MCHQSSDILFNDWPNVELWVMSYGETGKELESKAFEKPASERLRLIRVQLRLGKPSFKKIYFLKKFDKTVTPPTP